MTLRFLAIGECMIELSPEQGASYKLGFAGDTFNTAWYARQLTEFEALKVEYFSAVGDDDLSRQMADFMCAAGIEPHLAKVQDAGPGLYMIQLKDGERSFQYWRSISAARHLAADLDRFPAIVPEDVVYFSGITAAILPELRRVELLGRLAELSNAGAQVVFDPNLRPHLWPDAETMTRWTMTAAAIADIVLPSHEDEATHFGDVSSDATAQRYIENGATLVVVKNGPDPVVVQASDGDRFQYQPAVLDKVVDTTAAGDAFNAAFLADYLQHSRLRDAVRAGCVLARHVVSHKGALIPVSQLGLINDRARFSA
ncbi:sugar kinase [Roseibium sp.]|uniref:sugar kinase n=1 Tax=Roseibium sp. TaxID=1936156 RepID=UPI003B52086C